MPPRSRLWAKQRSTISARSLKASRATPDLSRARLLVTARRAASSPCQRENAEVYRLERLRPGLPADCRDTHGREPGASGPEAQGQEAFQHGWVSKSDPEAKIAKIGTTHLAAVDLDTGAVVAAERTRPMRATPRRFPRPWRRPRQTFEPVDAAPTSEDPAECVLDKGYHSRAVLRALNDSPWKTRIVAPQCRPAFRAGTVMRRRGARSPTTVRGSSPGSPAWLQAARRDRRALL